MGKNNLPLGGKSNRFGSPHGGLTVFVCPDSVGTNEKCLHRVLRVSAVNRSLDYGQA